jgi:hyperosmotically inducible protein
MNSLHRLILLTAITLPIGLVACEQGAAERAGKKMDRAAEKAGDKIDDASRKLNEPNPERK